MYKIHFSKTALKGLKKIDKRYHSSIIKAVERISTNPHLGKPLRGKLKSYWKIRFSRYRIIYKIMRNKLTITIIDVAHRKRVYKK